MLLWSLSLFCLLMGGRYFLKCAASRLGRLGHLALPESSAKKRRSLMWVAATVRELEEVLMGGLVPSMQQWARLESLPAPWGSLTYQSVQGLRASGGALLPTLKRLRELAEEQDQNLGAAQGKASQAYAQAIACSALVPVMGGALYWLLPSLQDQSGNWLLACLLAALGGVVAGFWVYQMAEDAMWGGIRKAHRPWILGAYCAGERFLAMVRSGTPPDLAWSKICELLSQDTLELASAWGHSVWETPSMKKDWTAVEKAIVLAGGSVKKVVHLSLMEGRACTERVEGIFNSLRCEVRTQIDRELSLLPTRALKPLFTCVAPGVLGLLAYGLWLTFAANGVDFEAF